MSVGFIGFKSVHRGLAYVSDDGLTWLLCDGRAVSRATYPNLSNIWPSGAYGSTDTDIHLPNLDNIAFRAQSSYKPYDTDFQSRTALSGTLPVGSGLGSYQVAGMQLHTHQDSQTTSTAAQNRNDGNTYSVLTFTDVPTQATIASGYTSTPTPVVVSGTTEASLDVAHTKLYFYICAT
jgi:hypothetical protein